MFAFGSLLIKEDSQRMMDLGKGITETCHEMYRNSKLGLGGEIAEIRENQVYLLDSSYLQRPEVVESLFYMWRFSHNEKYREYAEIILDNMNNHTRVDAGFHSIDIHGNPHDKMESFFMAETLKYLYLMYCDDHFISLDDYVFNTEAHPLSVRGKGLRKNSSQWVKIKATNEYDPPVGHVELNK